MAITKSIKIVVGGILDVQKNDICIETEDEGVFSLKELLASFDGLNIKLTCSYDEEQKENRPRNG